MKTLTSFLSKVHLKYNFLQNDNTILKIVLISLFCLLMFHKTASAQDYGLSFDGVNDYVSVSPIPTYNHSAITIEAWIKIVIPSGYSIAEPNIVSWGADANTVEFRIGISGSNATLQFGIDASGSGGGAWQAIYGATNINTGNWVHVAVVKNGTTSTLYINGVSETSGSITNSSPSLGYFEIGNLWEHGGQQNRYFPGLIDEVRIWNTARTQPEIQANMNKELAGSETGLTNYYKMTNGSGTSLTDNKGSSAGTLNNGVSWQQPGAYPVNVYVSGSYVACYANLKSAFDAINAGTHTGEIVLKLAGSTIETASAILNASSSPSSYTSVHIYPTVTGLSITGNLAGSLINLNGADNVTIDGSVNEAGVSKDLIITNTSISSATYTSAICFSGDASANTVKYCTIKGSQTYANGGIIFFTAGTTLGNNGNTIDHNDINCAADANRPISAIYSQGLSGVLNSGNIISNNNIFDFLNRGIASFGINIQTYSTEWTISGNSFYETSSFGPTADVAYMVINIADNAGTNFTISNNYIGGSSASCGGTPWTKTNVKYNNFTCINLNVGTGTASNIQGNEIRNFSHTDAGVTTWYGINIAAGKVNIGTTTANTIGASTGTGSITYEAGTGSNFYGIWLQGSSLLDVQNNVIGSITTYNTTTTGATDFTGIYNTGTGTINISGNTIGSTTELNSIYASSTSTGSAQTLYGINNYSANGSTISTISGNTISNMTNANTGTVADSYTCGIRFSSINGTKTVTNNTIRDLSTACGWNSAYYSPLTGISMEVSNTTQDAQTVTANTIYNLTNNYLSTGTSVCGILFKGSATASNTLTGNFIYNLSFLTPGNDIRGIILFNSLVFGTTTCANNILSLGGNTPANIYGLYAYSGSGTYNLYFNTVYIGGTLASGSTNSYAFFSATYTNTRDIRNNIFMNARSNGVATGKHFAVYLAYTVNTNLTINYNDYFTSGTGGMLGYHTTGTYNSAYDISTLDAWKAATLRDANSMNTNPLFAGAGGTTVADYKLTAKIAGVTIAAVPTDYSGYTRPNPPTLGSIEQDNPLPVSLSSFTSTLNGRDVKLNWITSSEQNNAGFEIQRAVVSSQYLVFSRVGYVSGKGTTSTPSSYTFEDRNMQTGKYQYRLKQIDNNGNFEFHNLNGTIEVGIPNKFDLSQNYPNPFNPVTKINFDLPADSKVTLVLYDVTGRQVTKLLNNELRTAGYYTMDFNGSSFASGIYFYRFIAESAGKQTIISKRMALIK